MSFFPELRCTTCSLTEGSANYPSTHGSYFHLQPGEAGIDAGGDQKIAGMDAVMQSVLADATRAHLGEKQIRILQKNGRSICTDSSFLEGDRRAHREEADGRPARTRVEG